MRHGSLFSGIGGFDLASQWCGWENVFQVENNEFCQKVLKKNFPKTKRYKDIYDFKGEKTAAHRGAIDIISGGFPCQPFSVAGKQKGKEDDRYLWPEMFRVIQEIGPTWVVGENVSGIIGVELDKVLFDLESIGYETQALVIPACAVDAPHRRDRVWVIGYSNKDSKSSIAKYGFEDKVVANTNKFRCEGLQQLQKYSQENKQRGKGTYGSIRKLLDGKKWWKNWEAESCFCRKDDGFPNRVDRIKALGNAIVPQVAYEIFKAIDVIDPKKELRRYKD